MGIAPDVGGRVGLGKPLEPDYFELQTSAQTAVLKEGLALVPNSLDVSFAQLGGNVWKYQTTPSHPQIPMFVLSALVRADNAEPSPLEEEHLQQILGKLSLKIKERLKENQQKPAEERDPFWVVVDQILRFMAKTFAFFDGLSQVTPELYQEGNYRHQLYLDKVLANWISLAEECFSISTHHLADKQIIEKLIKAAIEAQTKNRSALQNLLGQTLEFSHLLEQKKVSASAMTHSLVQALVPIAYGCVASSPLLTMAIQCMEHSEFKKPGLDLLLCQLGEAFSEQREIAKEIETFTKLLSLALSGVIIEGTGLKNNQYTLVILDKLDTAGAWAYQLSTGFISATGAFPSFIQAWTRELLPKESMNAEVLDLVVSQLILLAALRENPHLKGITPLLRGMRDALKQSLESIKEGPLLAQNLQALAMQAYLSIKKGNAAAYIKALDHATESVRLRRTDLQVETDGLIYAVVSLIEASHRLIRQVQVATMMNQSA